MAIDKSRLNPERFIIKFKTTVFRDIDEFIMDMKNIFAQMIKLFKNWRADTKYNRDRAVVAELKEEMFEKVLALQKDLQDKLEYITDDQKVDESVVGDVRPRLAQLKSLNGHTDLTVQPEETIFNLVDFFNNRILDSNLAVFKKIISHRKVPRE